MLFRLMLVSSPARAGGGWELRLRLQRSDHRKWTGVGWLSEDSLKGARASQLAGRESGKKSGPAKEARDHCFGVHEERGSFPLCPKKAEHHLSKFQRWA